jgi:hypothetical protein
MEEQKTDYAAHCIELATKHNCKKVHVCVQLDEEGNEVISYVKEPDYMSKLALMDKAGQIGMHMAGEELRALFQLKEESDRRTYSDKWEDEKYKLGVAQFCLSIIEIALNQFKKK